jgi:PhoPQ-activated pathogenicity-related protein
MLLFTHKIHIPKDHENLKQTAVSEGKTNSEETCDVNVSVIDLISQRWQNLDIIGNFDVNKFYR